MAAHVLNTQKISWDVKRFPKEIQHWNLQDPAYYSPLRGAAPAVAVRLHADAAIAIVEYLKGVCGQTSTIALVESSSNRTYAAEKKLEDGSTMIVSSNRPTAGSLTITVRAVICAPTGAYSPVPPISSGSQVDLSAVFMSLIPFVRMLDDIDDIMKKLEQEFMASGTIGGDLRTVADTIVYALDSNTWQVAVPGANIEMMNKQSITMGSMDGVTICGIPSIIAGKNGKASKPKKKNMTFKDAKNEFKGFASTHSWTPEERSLIPVFPDDYPVPPEAVKIARFYVETRTSRRPMNNFMWRGITSYGKSTGVELMAAFLDMPLLRMTCHTTMETQNFLSEFVPDNGVSDSVSGELPSFMEMAADPVSAYEAMSGKLKEDATCEDCLQAYGDAVLARSGSNTARFKHVESNFVKAISKGYIVEIQEISRIKDPGVLVGLNEYDRPGAVIPLVDGSFTRRNPNAMVIYTDNVGYASCRPVDPSVIRRMSFVIDSYQMPKRTVLDRVAYNTGYNDTGVLETMYTTWEAIQKYCKEQDITDGSVSVTELEMWAQAVQIDQGGNLAENCRMCVVAKATSDTDEQEAIMADVVALHLGIR